MATLQATRILEALEKARRVGRYEEAVTIDGCPIVLVNLSPDEYESIDGELEDLEELQYLHAFQMGHICRAIVEIGGHDLRDVDFVEDEVPSGRALLSASLPKAKAEELLKQVIKAGGEGSVAPDGETRMVRLERHEWMRTRVLSSWGREGIMVAWKKFSDVQTTAEERAKEGVQFRIPDESSEEKFRRLLGEMKEIEADLPSEMVNNILNDAGYLSKSSAEELEAVEQRMRKVAAEDAAAKAPEAESPQAAPQAAPQRPDPQDPQELMRRRQPLNRQAAAPIPAPRAEGPGKPPEVAPVPEQLRKAAQANSSVLSRSAKIAALEQAVDPSLEEVAAAPPAPVRSEVPELAERARDDIDGGAVARITDQPPVVGINPRFRRPPGT